MKRAVILHGTDGSPTVLVWQDWLRSQLEVNGYEMFFPQLPECHTPNLELYNAFLRDSGWDFEDNIIVGHSSGATTVLHLLQQEWFPHVKAAVLVGTFLNERLLNAASWYEPGQFDKLFVDTLKLEKINNKAGAFYFVHGDDDPYCDYGEARELSNQLKGTFITLPGAGHIAKSSYITELPELMEKMRQDGVL